MRAASESLCAGANAAAVRRPSPPAANKNARAPAVKSPLLLILHTHTQSHETLIYAHFASYAVFLFLSYKRYCVRFLVSIHRVYTLSSHKVRELLSTRKSRAFDVILSLPRGPKPDVKIERRSKGKTSGKNAYPPTLNHSLLYLHRALSFVLKSH